MVVRSPYRVDRAHMPKRHPNEPILQRLGHLIHQRREQLGLTREALGERLGTDAKNIYRLESGEENVGYLRLARIATALELELSQLVADDTTQTPWLLQMIQHGWTWRPPKPKPAGRCLEVLDLRAQSGISADKLEPEPIAWAEPPAGLGNYNGQFVAQVRGDAMTPKLRDGQWALFSRTIEPGQLAGRIAVLAEREDDGLVRFAVHEVAQLEPDGQGGLRLLLRSYNKQWPDRKLHLTHSGEAGVVGVLVRTL